MTLESSGVALVYGRDEVAIEAAQRLADRLDITVLLSRPGDVIPRRSNEFPVLKGTIRNASGHLGAFELAIDDYALPQPSSRARLVFGSSRNGATSTCDLILDLSGGAPLFPAHALRPGYLRADPRDRGRGKDDAQQRHRRDRPQPAHSCGMSRCKFALRHCEVDDVVWTADITSGIDVRLCRLLPAVHANATGRTQLDASGTECEPIGQGLTAQRIDQMACAHGPRAPRIEVDKTHLDLLPVARDGLKGCPGVQFDSFVAKRLCHDCARLGRGFLEDLRAALNLNHPAADSPEELVAAIARLTRMIAPGSQVPSPQPSPEGRGGPCLLYTSPSPRARTRSRMPASA